MVRDMSRRSASARVVVRKRTHGGYTLIEMIVVLAIVGLMLGLAIDRGPVRSERLNVETATIELLETLRLARASAITENRTVTVTTAAHAYWAQGRSARTLPTSVVITGESVISFAPDGSSSGGRVSLEAGAQRIDLSVDWLTGRVHRAQ
jgi:general secretion pathway protein H